MRWLLLIPLLSLTACSDPGAGLSPETSYAEAHEAMLDHDADRAVALLRSAAERGHLVATAVLADAYERGSLYGPVGYGEWERVGGAIVLPVRVWPGQAGRWERRFGRLLADSLAIGSPNAAMLQANRLLFPHPDERTPARRQQALALLQPLAEDGHALAALTLALQLREDDPEAAERWLGVAQEAGHPQVCYLRAWFFDEERADFYSAAGLERYLDTLDDCPISLDQLEYVEERLSGLRAAADAGHAEAVAVLDSLEAAGVLARYEALAAAPDA